MGEVRMAEIIQAAEAAKAAARFQNAADALKKQAAFVRDPAKQERLWQATYAKEKEAYGESKKARLMASGWGQGTGFGIGISSAVGMGLGNLVGTLLSGVVTVPGSLIGAGIGALHGPWYRLGDAVAGNGGGRTKANENAGHDRLGKNINKSEGDETDDDEEVHRAIVEAAKKLEEEEKAKAGEEKTDPK